MNPPQVYLCSPSWTLLPPHTLPLGRPNAPAPSIQYRASNLDWWLVSYMILYMFQCHSPKSPHPLPLPESKRVFYTSVSLLLSHIQGYCYHLSKFHIYALVYCIGEGNGNPLQCSCLENPRDGGAWWAAVYGVTQSRTRLKWLSILYWRFSFWLTSLCIIGSSIIHLIRTDSNVSFFLSFFLPPIFFLIYVPMKNIEIQ